MADLEKNLDDWLGGPILRGEKAQPKEKAKPGGKVDVSEAVAFMEKGAMSEAQLALGLLGISFHAKQVLAGGLTNEALFTLIEAKSKYMKNGKKPSLDTIKCVLEAVAALDEFVDQDALERVRAARAKR